VLAATFDGASVNWGLVKIHDTKQEVHKVLNIYAPEHLWVLVTVWKRHRMWGP